MQKIVLSLFVFTSIVSSNEAIDDKKKLIEYKRAEIQKLQKELNKLEISLPENIEKEQELILAKEKKDNSYITHTEFGFSTTSGNTDTTLFNLDLDVKKRWDKHIFNLGLDAHYADDEDIETKNKYLLELIYDYEFTDRFAFNYLTGYKKDRFSGFDYQFYTGPGAKYKAIVSKKHNLTVDGNILYSQDEIEDIHYDVNGAAIEYPNSDNIATNSTLNGYTKDYTSLRFGLNYEWQILENLKFVQEANYRTELSDTENFFVYSKSALISKITDIFSFGMNYKVDYVNLPADGKEHTDTTLTANIIVDY